MVDLCGSRQIAFIDKNFKPRKAQHARNRVASDLGPDARLGEFAFERLDFLPVI
jgi:hypothetical protein